MCQSDCRQLNAKVLAATLLLGALAFAPSLVSQGQDTKQTPLTVSAVSVRSSGKGTVVSIAADGSLNRAQTWQDREGYHVVVPSADAQNSIKLANGIKVRQLDQTLEIVLSTKPGANVNVQQVANRLTLNIEGKLESRQSEDNADTESAGLAQEGAVAGRSGDDRPRSANTSPDLLVINDTSAGSQTDAKTESPAANLPSSASQAEKSPEVATAK